MESKDLDEDLTNSASNYNMKTKLIPDRGRRLYYFYEGRRNLKRKA